MDNDAPCLMGLQRPLMNFTSIGRPVQAQRNRTGLPVRSAAHPRDGSDPGIVWQRDESPRCEQDIILIFNPVPAANPERRK